MALIYPQDSDTFPPAQMPVVKLSIAHVAAGLKGHCPLVEDDREELQKLRNRPRAGLELATERISSKFWLSSSINR